MLYTIPTMNKRLDNIRLLVKTTVFFVLLLVLIKTPSKASAVVECSTEKEGKTYCSSSNRQEVVQCTSGLETVVWTCDALSMCLISSDYNDVGFICVPAPTNTPDPTLVPVAVPTETPQDTQMVDSLFLWEVNPLTINGNDNPYIAFVVGKMNVLQFGTPAGFLNALMPYLFSLAGMILFIMIVWGGFEMMRGAADTKAFDAGKQRVVSALIGFGLLFISYWIAQIVQFIFGVNVLG